MFKTKRDVDRHVTHVLNRIRDVKERNSRGYQFAKLYYDVSDYESAKRHLQEFLNVREVVPQPHKMMGQICEALHDKKKALESYKRSLELDPDQTELVLKVCELYCDPGVQVNPDNAKLWIERAEKHYPGHYTIFNLKERVIDKDSEGDTADLEKLINIELLKNPRDVKLHIRLLKLYIQSRDVDRAYNHALKTERQLPFVSSLCWYECLADIYQVYQDQHGCGDDNLFYTHKLFALCTLTSLRLQADETILLSAVKSLNQFDQDLNEAQNIRKQSTEWESFLTEMKGQFFFQIAFLVLKRALKGQLSWTNTCSLSAVCCLLSDSLPAVDQKSSWYCQLPQDRRKFYDHLHMQGCDRLSQGGHMIHSVLSKQDDGQWARKLRQKFCTAQGCEKLHSIIFTDGDMRRKKDNSYLLMSNIFTQTSLDVPSKAQLLKYDSVAYQLHTDNLNHLVWLALRYHSNAEDVQKDYEQIFGHQVFPSMKFGMMDLSGGDPGTLCQLDVQVFLYVCVRWVAMQQREARRTLHPIPDKPDLLPVCLSNNLCTQQQTDWWNAMYRLQTNTASEKLAKMIGILARGLETLRLVTPHTMPLFLIVHVARTLDKRAEEMEGLDPEGIISPRLAAVLYRAAFYWKAAANILDRIDRNSSIKMPKDMLFPTSVSINDPAQIKELQGHIKFAMACVAMREERYEEALSDFENLPQAKAAYYSGMVYRKLFESLDVNQNAGGGGGNSQQTALLSKAKNSLYQALDRLESENNEELKNVVKEDLDGVVCKLISLESGGALGDSFVSNHSLSYNTAESDESTQEEPIKQPRTPLQSSSRYSQVVVNPSPTRIEVQFKALESTNTAFSARLSTLEESVRTSEKLIQELFKQLRESKDENRSLREQIQVLSLQGLSNMNMSMQRQPIGQSFPGTPQQQRNMLNAMNNSFGSVPQTYDYQVPPVIPPHLAHYGYAAGSPRPGSAYGAPNFEDELNNIDGEYYDPEADGDCFSQDQNLIQEWPFGHKTGVEGKSTITYSPQQGGKGPGFVNALRGQSIQYGAYQQPASHSPAAPQMPGPGFFSQTNQPMVPPSVLTQPGVHPAQSQLGVAMNVAGSVPSISPSYPQKGTQGVAMTRPTTTPMMPPNAVMSSSVEAKPKLIPGSVGVPPPNQQTGPPSQSVLSTPTVDQRGKTPQSTQGAGLFGQSGVSVFAGQTTPVSITTPTSSILGQTTPGSAATMLSQLASKQQQPQNPLSVNVPTSTPQKTVFKGFSFTSTPKITETKSGDIVKDDKPTAVANEAPKPFSGFSFTSAKTFAPATSSSSPTQSAVSVGQATAQVTSTPQGQAGSGFLFGKNTPTTSFGAIASQASTGSAFNGSQGDGFSGAGLPVFGKSPSPRRRDPSCGSDDHVEEYEPSVDFKPIVPLPALIQVKTGEEDEQKMFADRAKLFRFDGETKQWKERGIGELKILKHRQTGQFRVLMRREQVLKLCANHAINTDMKLTPMMSSDKTWVWTAPDFSEEEMKYEKLAARFKNVDRASEFKSVFEKCREELKTVNDNRTEGNTADSVNASNNGVASKGQESLSEMFKPKAGAWTCDGCYIQSGPDVLVCPCCGTKNPGATVEQLKAASDKEAPSAVQCGFTFGPAPSSQNTAGAFNFGASGISTDSIGTSSSTKPVSGFSFGPPRGSSLPLTVTEPDSSFEVTNKPGVTPEEIQAAASQSAQSGQAGGGFKFGSVSKLQTASSQAFTFGTGGANAGISAESKSGMGSGFVFGKPIEGTSAGFNINKEETKYPFEASIATPKKSEAESAVSGNSLLAKYLTCPENWTCYKCQMKLEGMAEVCPKCEVTREESVGKEKEFPLKQSGFAFSSSGSSLFSTGQSEQISNEGGSETGFAFGKPESIGVSSPSKPSSEGFNFSFPPASDGPKAQPPAAVGSGFNFSLSITRSLTETTPTKSTAQASNLRSPKSPEITDDGYYVNKDGDDSHIYFEPVVPLPEKVEIKLGEEDEEVVFTHRAKLYRFSAGEWKERGLGDVKVLYHAEKNKARLIMRRAAILKICCNHYITPDINFKPMPHSNNCALVWFALDFTEDEPQTEQFSIKFKNADIVSKFESAIQEVKDRIAHRSGETIGTPKKATDIETVGAKITTTGQSETKSNPQSIEDPDCIFVREEKATDEQIQKARQFKLPDHFYLYERLPDCAGCRGCDENWTYESEIAQSGEDEDEDEEDDEEYDTDDYEEDEEEEGEENEATKVKKEKSKTSLKELNKGSEETTSLMFGNVGGGGFSFASLAKTSPNQPFGGATGTSKPFSFEGAGKQLFGAGGRASGGVGDGGSDDEDVQQGDDPHFEPVVPLPELIEVKTGEEDEVSVYSQRAKIFRFDKEANQWKERGIGDMKILKHKETGKYRLILRREQIHKLACNHLLTADILFMPMNTSETSWCWTTQDFSESEGKLEQLAIKFKTIDLAKAFKSKVDAIQEELSRHGE